MTKFVAPVTRENLHKFKLFKVVDGDGIFTAAPEGGVYKLATDDGSVCPWFSHVSGPSRGNPELRVCIGLARLAGIEDDTPTGPSTEMTVADLRSDVAAIRRMLDTLERNIDLIEGGE